MGGCIGTANHKIPIFNEKNYDSWSIKMRAYLRSQDMWNLVENGYDKGDKGMRLKDGETLCVILDAIPQSLVPCLGNAETSKEAWTFLKEKYCEAKKENVPRTLSRQSSNNIEAGEEVEPSTPSASSPMTNCGSQFEVFLSFRGPDTRKRFIGHLDEGFHQRGISSFIDSKELKKGEQIHKILEYIDKSKIFVVIFSERYAQSRWCLKELARSVESGKEIVPVFFGVEPSDVRNQGGTFKSAFQEHESNKKLDQTEVKKWRQALKKVGDLSGFNLEDVNGDEAELKRAIIHRVSSTVNRQPLLVAKPPIGIETRVQDVKKILENGSNGVHVVGIIGMGGIGKTTIAEAVYNELAEGFDGATCFLSNVRENAEQTNGLVSLQKQVFLEILKDTNTILSNAAHGARLIKTRVGPKRVLLILDDVDSVEQINALAGGRDWFGSGSVIIITTRDIEVLHAIHVKEDEIYMPKVLNQGQSHELFLRHAFNGEEPKGDYDQLTNEVVAAAGGLPLTLEVIGSLLTLKSVEEWKHTLKKLKNIPHQKVQERLKLSYNKLDAFVQKIFLDISCFFIGKERKYATYMWEACGWHPNYAIEILVQRSLIKIDEKSREFQMHDQIRDMGRAIVKEESSGKPEKQSRLWISKDSFNLLKMKGTDDVEAIQLFCDRKDEVSMEIESLAAMSQLRMLQLDSTTLKGEYEHFPSNVRWLQWSLQDLSSLPTSLHLDNIVVLDLSRSSIVQVWDVEKVILHQLKVLHLQHCESLLVCPDFTKMPNLERLSFRGCRNISRLHSSIGLLKKLTHLNLAWCESLKELPEAIYELVSLEELDLSSCRIIKELGDSKSMEQHVLEKLKVLHLDYCFNLIMCPDFTKMPNLKSLSFIRCGKMSGLHLSIGCLKSLTSLNLTCCESLEGLPQDVWRLTSLQELNLQECSQITALQMMDSVSYKQLLLENLTSLNLSNCRGLITCPDFTSMPHLKNLKLYGCEKISKLDPSIGHLKSLIELDLRDCISLKKLPQEIFRMTSLKNFNVSNCPKISTLPPLPPSLIWLDARECSQLESIADVSNVKGLQQLDLTNCVRLVDVPGIEQLKCLKRILLKGCGSLSDSLVKSIKENVLPTPSPYSPMNTCVFEFEVFLSFKGADSWKGFIGHLYEALHQIGISTFINTKELEKEEQIDKLLEYIDKSNIFVVIFSKRYAQSRWCLKELARSVESRKKIVPVFFGVEPSEVRNQGGTFKSAFQEHESNKKLDQAEVTKWRLALKIVGNLSGFNLKDVNGDEAELKRAIIHRVLSIVNKQPLLVAEPPIGIETRVQDVKKILENGSNGVHVVGIVGMGGLGKTTIATAVYNKLAEGFNGTTCFLSNVRENAEQPNGLVSLQKQVIHDILKDGDTYVSSIAHGASLIKSRVGHKRVLLILDDVDSVEQIHALAGGRDWFGSGSVIIITTRYKDVLRAIHVKEDEIYMPEVLNQSQSRELFLQYAFNGEEPKGEYHQLINEVVAAVGGLPLTLKAFGSLLTCDMNVEEWKSTCEKLKNIPLKEVQQRLKLSYHKLEVFEQKIFLDICCFFIGNDRKYATYMWKACGWHPNIAIRILIEKSLIKIDEKSGEFRMHDQIRDMGRAIVKEESFRKAEKQSRLWISKDSFNLLKRKGTKDVEAIQLFCEREDEVCMDIASFAAMSNLRMLLLKNVALKGEYERFPRNVRWLQWSPQDLETLPSSLHLDNIAILDLSRSSICRVWDQQKIFHQLKVLHLNFCSNLITCPDFTKMPNLERLSFNYCWKMIVLDPSIGLLKKLTHLNLGDCKSLKELSEAIYELISLKELDLKGCETITAFPPQSGDSKTMEQHVLGKLKVLHLNFCSNLITCPDFTKMPNLERLSFNYCWKMIVLDPSIGLLKKLTHLNLGDCKSLKELSEAIYELISLKELDLKGCETITAFPPQSGDSKTMEQHVLGKLKVLHLNFCSNLITCPDFTKMPNLERLSFKYCWKMTELDPSIGLLKKLTHLNLGDCKSLKELPEAIYELISLEELDLKGCETITAFAPQSGDSKSMEQHVLGKLKVLHLDESSNLIMCPDFSKMRKLERLSFRSCMKMSELYPSIGLLKKLTHLNLGDCKSLKELPEAIYELLSLEELDLKGCETITAFPLQSGDSKSTEQYVLGKLKVLHLDECFNLIMCPDFSKMPNLERLSFRVCRKMWGLHPSIGRLKSLTHLNLEYCESLKGLPQEVSQLISLPELNLSNCSKISTLPLLPPSLIRLHARDCSQLKSIADVSNVKGLQQLDLKNCMTLVDVPGIEQLKYIMKLKLEGCGGLQDSFFKRLEAANFQLLYAFSIPGRLINDRPSYPTSITFNLSKLFYGGFLYLYVNESSIASICSEVEKRNGASAPPTDQQSIAREDEVTISSQQSRSVVRVHIRTDDAQFSFSTFFNSWEASGKVPKATFGRDSEMMMSAREGIFEENMVMRVTIDGCIILNGDFSNDDIFDPSVVGPNIAVVNFEKW